MPGKTIVGYEPKNRPQHSSLSNWRLHVGMKKLAPTVFVVLCLLLQLTVGSVRSESTDCSFFFFLLDFALYPPILTLSIPYSCIKVWLDVQYGVDGSNGTLEAPFKSIQKFSAYLRDCGFQSTSIVLFVAPGVYTSPWLLDLPLNISLLPCQTCHGSIYDQNDILFDIRASIPFWRGFPSLSTSLTIHSIVFSGANADQSLNKPLFDLSSNSTLILDHVTFKDFMITSHFVNATQSSVVDASYLIVRNNTMDIIQKTPFSESSAIFYLGGSESVLTVSYCVFESNTIYSNDTAQQMVWPSYQGGVIHTFGEISVFASQFRLNGIILDFDLETFFYHQRTPVCGGAMALYGQQSLIKDSLFEKNFLVLNHTLSNVTRGGAICMGGTSSLFIQNSTFYMNSAGLGGAIASTMFNLNKGASEDATNLLSITGANFTDNACSTRGCAIDFMPQFHRGALEIEKTIFSDNLLIPYNDCAAPRNQVHGVNPLRNQSPEQSAILAKKEDFMKKLKIGSFDIQSNSNVASPYFSNTTQALRSKLYDEASSTHGRSGYPSNQKENQILPRVPKQPRSSYQHSEPGTIDDMNPVFGGAAIAVFGAQQYFAYPSKISVVMSNVSFTKNKMMGECRSFGLAMLLNQVTVVSMENVLFEDHRSNLADSVLSMRLVSRLLVDQVTFRNNSILSKAKERRKLAIWNIQDQGTLPSSFDSLQDYPTGSIRKNFEVGRQSLFGARLEEKSDFRATKAFYNIKNVTLENNVARDALIHCTGAHSIRLVGCNWKNLKTRAAVLKPSLIWFRSISANVYIDDSTIDNVQLPLVIAYVGESVFLKNSNFSSFSGTQTLFVNLYEVSTVNISQCAWNSNKATGLSISSVKEAIINETIFFNNYSPALAGGLRFSEAKGSIHRCNFTSNSGLNGGALSTNSDLKIFNSAFFNNKASTSGGAMMSISSPSIHLDNVICANNEANVRGGCLAVSGTEPDFLTSFNDHFEYDYIVKNQVSSPRTSLRASSSLFHSNVAATGGAVSLYSGIDSQWHSSTFLQNTALDQGGAIEIWESFYFSRNLDAKPMQLIHGLASTHKMVACNFTRNLAGDAESYTRYKTGPSERALKPGAMLPLAIGGAVLVHQAELDLRDCHLEGNIANFEGGAIYAANVFKTRFSVLSSTFVYNSAQVSGGAIFIGEQSVQPILPTYSYCNIALKDSIFEKNFAPYGGAFSWAPAGKCSHQNGTTEDAYLTNLIFSKNNARQSGGAIYFVGQGESQFYSYANLTMEANYANLSGNHFFYNSMPMNGLSELEQGQKAHPPKFCIPGLCHATLDPLLQANWGPIYASSFWRIEYDLTPLDRIRFVRPLSLPYRLLDLYDQTVAEPLILSAIIEPLTPHQSIQLDKDDNLVSSDQNIDSGMVFNGFTDTMLILSLGVDGKYARDPLVAYRHNSTNPFVSPVNVSVSIQLVPSSYTTDLYAFFRSDQAIFTQVYRCPEGFGLWPLSGADSLFSCLPCPIGTYNFDGDGQCYSCHGDSIELNCQTDTVTALNGFWASRPQSSSNMAPSSGENVTTPMTNELFIAKCRPGQCLTGGCEKGRTGIMCGSCVDSAWETLFSHCSDHLCAHPQIPFYFITALVLIGMTLTFHCFANRVPVTTMHLSTSIVLGMMIIHSPLDWALPLAMPSLSSLLCGFRASAIERMIFFSFLPYASIPLLAILFMIVQVPKFIFKCENFNWLAVLSNEMSGLKILKSIYGLLIVLSVPSLKASLDWTQCTELGNRWIFGPSVHCASEQFKIARLASMLILIPISILPIAISCVSIRLELCPAKNEKKLKFLAPISQLHLNPLAGTVSRIISMLDLIGKVFIGISIALWAQNEKLRAIILASVFIVLMIINGLGSPFLTMIERISGTLPYGVLAVMAVAEPNLFVSSTYPIIALGVFLLFMILTTILFVVGHRMASKRFALAVEDAQWQKVASDTQNSDEDSMMQEQ